MISDVHAQIQKDYRTFRTHSLDIRKGYCCESNLPCIERECELVYLKPKPGYFFGDADQFWFITLLKKLTKIIPNLSNAIELIEHAYYFSTRDVA